MASIPFVDAHVHFWDLSRLRYPWLSPPFADGGPNGNVERIARDYLPGDHRAALAGIELAGAVHVEAGADPDAALDETRWLDEQAAAAGLPSAVVAHAPLDAPDAAVRLARQAAHPRVRGVRDIVNWHADPQRSYTPADRTRDAAWQAGYALLAHHGFSFDLQCYPGQVPALAPLIARHEEVTVIVNHLGMPVPGDPDGVDDWRGAMRALATMPHVAVKLSGFGFVARDWTVDRIRPIVAEAVELFGTARCLVASDYPTDTLFAPAERCLAALHELTADYSDDERRDLWGRNANRLYRLGLEI